jgi:hypothetical protein
MLAGSTDDEGEVAEAARSLALSLVESTDAVRGILVRVARLGPVGQQAPLFPVTPALRRAL